MQNLKRKKNNNERHNRTANAYICNTDFNSIADYMADERIYKEMNDRFKFRVWNIETKELLLVYSFDKNFIQATSDYVVPSIRRFNINDCILMQCTGLKDKNGKLIYEGDICEYEFEEIGKQKAIIEFNTKYATFLMKPLNDFQYANINDCEVIGNKFENPELLKECENE